VATTEPVVDPSPPRSEHAPAAPSETEIARRNIVWGWALFGLASVLFAGTIGVAYIYLWLS
jgi:hypothetical protein